MFVRAVNLGQPEVFDFNGTLISHCLWIPLLFGIQLRNWPVMAQEIFPRTGDDAGSCEIGVIDGEVRVKSVWHLAILGVLTDCLLFFVFNSTEYSFRNRNSRVTVFDTGSIYGILII